MRKLLRFCSRFVKHLDTLLACSVLAQHSSLSVGVDRMQPNFEPMRKQIEAWQRSQLIQVTATVIIYAAFAEGEL